MVRVRVEIIYIYIYYLWFHFSFVSFVILILQPLILELWHHHYQLELDFTDTETIVSRSYQYLNGSLLARVFAELGEGVTGYTCIRLYCTCYRLLTVSMLAVASVTIY